MVNGRWALAPPTGGGGGAERRGAATRRIALAHTHLAATTCSRQRDKLRPLLHVFELGFAENVQICQDGYVLAE